MPFRPAVRSSPTRFPATLRPSRRTVLLGAAALGTAGGGVSWCAWARDGDRDVRGRLTIATGTTQGVYVRWATALAAAVAHAYPGLTLIVLPTDGSVENMGRLADGSAQLALAAMDAAADAEALAPGGGVRGAARRPGPRGMALALARVYDDFFHVLLRPGGPVNSLADLAGRRVATGSTASGTALIARRLLQANGTAPVTSVPLNLAAGVSALARAEVDAVGWSGGVPTPFVSTAVAAGAVRLLSLPAEAARLCAAFPDAYRPATIPAGSYGALPEIRTVGVPNLLLARSNLPAPLVRAVLDSVFRHRDEITRQAVAGRALDVRLAVSTRPLRLHPAAAAYYRDVKP